MADLDSLFLDKRSIDDMPFGAEAPEHERPKVAASVRETLSACGVKIADDINRLGCTGVLANAKDAVEANDKTFDVNIFTAAIASARFLRLGLAGGGVGLPCFVPPTRYCLVHETVGGLQDNQRGLYPEFAESISRPLTAFERGKYEMVNAARTAARTDPDEAADILSGRKQVPGVVETGESYDDPEMTVLQGARLGVQTWKCPDHATTNWACRYCAAQAVVEGPLDVHYALKVVDAVPQLVDAPELSKLLEIADQNGVARVRVYVRVADMTRKLTR